MANPKFGPEIGRELNVLRIVERFKRGRIGEVYENVVMSDEVQLYFTEQMINWAEKELAGMTPFAREEFKNMVTPEILWQNFSTNFVLNGYANSMKRWLDTIDLDFDKLIIEFATAENAKKVIDALRVYFEGLARELQARNIDRELANGLLSTGKGKKGPQFFS